MREMRILYNPKSRRGRFIYRLDKLTEAAQERGFRVSLHRLSSQGDVSERIMSGLGDNSILVACGGDGTFQVAANAMVDCDMNIPMGLLPYGTSNDFADSVGLTINQDSLLQYIDTNNIGPVDLGRVGNRCFVNVFSVGQIIKASHEVERTYKDHLGMLAYYLHTVGQLPRIAPFTLTLQGDVQDSFKCLLFLALNSTSAGGFINLAPQADFNDGKLDIIAIRECSLSEMATVFFSVLRGEHQNNPAVLYAKAANLEILGPDNVATDTDGERGPGLPVTIQVLPGRIQLLGVENRSSRKPKSRQRTAK